MLEINVVHQGRGGYVECEGKQYPIELFERGHFSISFPAGNRHARLQEHLDTLKAFAASRDPKWAIENRSKKYR